MQKSHKTGNVSYSISSRDPMEATERSMEHSLATPQLEMRHPMSPDGRHLNRLPDNPERSPGIEKEDGILPRARVSTD